MNLRDGVLIERDAIGAADLDLLMGHVRQARMTDSPVANFHDPQDTHHSQAQHSQHSQDTHELTQNPQETQNPQDTHHPHPQDTHDLEWVVDRDIRDTQQVHLPDAIASRLNGIDDANILRFVNPFYRVEVRDREPLQVLHYGVGGHYIPHVDAETLYKDDIGLDMWEKTLDRDLSVVYFLNDDFEGGELFFPALDLVIQPAAGTLVCFPSDHNYIHGVKPVTAGHRYTAVTWMRIRGMPTVDEINQMALDEYHRRWPKQIDQHPRVAKGGMPQR